MAAAGAALEADIRVAAVSVVVAARGSPVNAEAKATRHPGIFRAAVKAAVKEDTLAANEIIPAAITAITTTGAATAAATTIVDIARATGTDTTVRRTGRSISAAIMAAITATIATPMAITMHGAAGIRTLVAPTIHTIPTSDHLRWLV